MRLSISLPVYLTAVSITLVSTPVLALSPTEVNQIAKAITVRIEDDDNGNGSGIIVK